MKTTQTATPSADLDDQIPGRGDQNLVRAKRKLPQPAPAISPDERAQHRCEEIPLEVTREKEIADGTRNTHAMRRTDVTKEE